MRNNLDRAIRKGKLEQGRANEIFGNIRGSVDLQDLAEADIIIEAIIEKIEPKKSF
nr:3-hydroxyacyl-CoA dehydrogenase NAD-binding domain-containing protein [Metabacillus rhizolycopersici]